MMGKEAKMSIPLASAVVITQSQQQRVDDVIQDLKTNVFKGKLTNSDDCVAVMNDSATCTNELRKHEADVDVSSELQPEASAAPGDHNVVVHPNGESVAAETRQSESVFLDDDGIKKRSLRIDRSCHAVTLVVGEYVEAPNIVSSATTLRVTTNVAATLPVTSNTTAINSNTIVTSRREHKVRPKTNNTADERIPGAFQVRGIRRSSRFLSFYNEDSTTESMDDLEDSQQIIFTSYSDRVDGPLQEAGLDPKLGDTKVIDTEALHRKGVIDTDYCLDDEDNLAVAVPVEADQGDDRFHPAAIEFDPDQKNDAASKSRNKTYECLVIVVLIIIVSVVVGVVVALSSNRSRQPTVNPRDMLGITQFVVSQLGPYASAVEDVNSPYHMALNWMTYYDPLNLTIEAPNFMQRYLLAYMYYATSASRPWGYCVPPINNTTQPGPCRYGSVSHLREGYDDAYVKSNGYWLSSDDECQWAGIVCDRSGNIVNLALAGMNMTGSLSSIQQLLPFVNNFDLSRNELQGPLPGSTFQNSKHLRSVLLADNSLTGSIPSEIWSLRNLRKLSLWTNTLTGLLPDSLDFWKDAKDLQLSKNRFNGTIPSTISRLQNAQKILLDNNLLTGTLPTGLFINPSLVLLYLDSNILSKNITKMIDLPAIVELNLGSNRLTGSVPDDIYNCKTLGVLDLHNNFLNGSLSSLIGKLTFLNTLALADNSFTGTIPPAVANLTVLEEASFDGTNFSGTMPSSLCTMKLKTLTADCDKITCTCCTCW